MLAAAAGAPLKLVSAALSSRGRVPSPLASVTLSCPPVVMAMAPLASIRWAVTLVGPPVMVMPPRARMESAATAPALVRVMAPVAPTSLTVRPEPDRPTLPPLAVMAPVAVSAPAAVSATAPLVAPTLLTASAPLSVTVTLLPCSA